MNEVIRHELPTFMYAIPGCLNEEDSNIFCNRAFILHATSGTIIEVFNKKDSRDLVEGTPVFEFNYFDETFIIYPILFTFKVENISLILEEASIWYSNS